MATPSQFDRIITQLLTDITHFCLPVGSRPTSTNDVINIAQGIPPLPRISTPVSLLIKSHSTGQSLVSMRACTEAQNNSFSLTKTHVPLKLEKAFSPSVVAIVVEPIEDDPAEKVVDTGDLKPPAMTNVLSMTAHPG